VMGILEAAIPASKLKFLSKADDLGDLSKVGKTITRSAKDVAEETAEKVDQVPLRSLVSRQGPSEMTGSKVKKLTKDMKENGFDPAHPIEVAEVDGKKIILDGHHRAEAATRAGIKEVPVKTKSVTLEQADNLNREAAEAAAERAARRR
jgi:filamentous hemagglutinin